MQLHVGLAPEVIRGPPDVLLSDEPGARGSPVGDHRRIKSGRLIARRLEVWNIEDVPTKRIASAEVDVPQGSGVGMNAAARRVEAGLAAIAADHLSPGGAVESPASVVLRSCKQRAAWVARIERQAPHDVERKLRLVRNFYI